MAQAACDQFDDVMGRSRGSNRPDAPQPEAATGNGAHVVCSGCHNEPYLSDGDWYGHDEDCPRLRQSGDATCTHCSDCDRAPVYIQGRWEGHFPDCAQQGAAPDLYDPQAS